MIYKCKPDNVDPKDVSRVTNYIVSYACKGSETVVEEKRQWLILSRRLLEKKKVIKET